MTDQAADAGTGGGFDVFALWRRALVLVALAALVVLGGASVAVARTDFGRYLIAFANVTFLQRYAAAESDLTALIAESPRPRYASLALLATAHRMQGDTAAALDVLDLAVQHHPADPRAQTKRCVNGLRAGEVDRVRDSCDRALELVPDSVLYRARLAFALARQGDSQRARLELEQVQADCAGPRPTAREARSGRGLVCGSVEQWLGALSSDRPLESWGPP